MVASGSMGVARWCCQLTTDRDEPPSCTPADKLRAGRPADACPMMLFLPAACQRQHRTAFASAGEPGPAAFPCSSHGDTPAAIFNDRCIKGARAPSARTRIPRLAESSGRSPWLHSRFGQNALIGGVEPRSARDRAAITESEFRPLSADNRLRSGAPSIALLHETFLTKGTALHRRSPFTVGEAAPG